MITFILIATLIVAACLAIMLRPLLTAQGSEALERDEQNIHYAKTRLTELDEQLASATISQSDYDNLRLEIEATLAQDINLDEAAVVTQTESEKGSNAVVITLLCTLLPFAALVLYQITGTPAALDPNNLTTHQALNTPANTTANLGDQQDINQMVTAIEQRLQENPDDSQGWAILSRTYMVMERYQDAYNANLKLLELNGDSAALYTQLADSAALIAGGRIAGQPSEYIQKALAIDPVYPQALWLAGLNSAQAGNVARASEYWNTLLPLLANSPQQQQELRDIIEQTIGSQAASEIVADTPAEQEIVTTQNQGLTVNVEISSAVASQLAPTDSVFVFARAQSGPPAPLAVKRLTVADLPTQIQLSDGDSMIEQFKLSLFEDVVVIARVSKSGNPIAQTGDIQSNTVSTKNNTRDEINLELSEIVE